MFGHVSIQVRRAVMATLLSQLPVFFNNTEEIQSYINGHPIQDTDDKILTAKEGNYASDRKLKTALRRRSRAKAAEPFYGKGMTYFREHFDEIMDYYLKTHFACFILEKYILMDGELMLIIK